MNLGDPFEVQKRAIEIKRENMDDLEKATLHLYYVASLDLNSSDKAHVPIDYLEEVRRVLEDRGLIWPVKRS